MCADTMTPAALAALSRGDLRNARIAMTKGGIEAQEAAGQRLLVETCLLPREVTGTGLRPEDCLAYLCDLGFVLTPERDDLFFACKLPPGWSFTPTDHSMWSRVLDQNGHERLSVFYKAAFYDRRAFARLAGRFSIGSVLEDYYGYSARHGQAVIVDALGVAGEVVQVDITDADRRADDALEGHPDRSHWEIGS